MATRADEIAAACRALARYNRVRDGWQKRAKGVARTRLTVSECAEAEGACREDVGEVETVLMQLGIDPRREYDARSIRALVLSETLAGPSSRASAGP